MSIPVLLSVTSRCGTLRGPFVPLLIHSRPTANYVLGPLIICRRCNKAAAATAAFALLLVAILAVMASPTLAAEPTGRKLSGYNPVSRILLQNEEEGGPVSNDRSKEVTGDESQAKGMCDCGCPCIFDGSKCGPCGAISLCCPLIPGHRRALAGYLPGPAASAKQSAKRLS